MTIPSLTTPVPISKVQSRYLVHSASQASHLRRTHNITGVLVGNLPQAPQQNVFSGLPLELMPEEARLLVERGAAYIVDDVSAHKAAFLENGLSGDEKHRFRELVEKQSRDAANAQAKHSEEKKAGALQRIAEKERQAEAGSDTPPAVSGTRVGNGDMDNWNDMPEGMLEPRSRSAGSRTKSRRRGAERSASSSIAPMSRASSAIGGPPSSGARTPAPGEAPPAGPPGFVSRDSRPPQGPARSRSRDDNGPHRDSSRSNSKTANPDVEEDSLFGSIRQTTTSSDGSWQGLTPAHDRWGVTPSSSAPPLDPQAPLSGAEEPLPAVPESYAVYKHMHSKGYFLTPGLRFGCQYTAYPGDPLRYHSHFLVDGKGWDEEFSMMEIVGGGRLGTGVKKGFLLGGEVKKTEDSMTEIQNAVDGLVVSSEQGAQDDDGVRTFSVEWAGM